MKRIISVIALIAVMLFGAARLADAGHLIYAKETVSPARETPLSLKAANKFSFTVQTDEGDGILVMDVSHKPNRVIVKEGSKVLFSLAPERPQMSFALDGTGRRELAVYLNYDRKTALTVYTLDSRSEPGDAMLWNDDVSGAPVCLCGTVSDAKAALSEHPSDAVRYVICASVSDEEKDAFLHEAYDAGVRCCPEFLGLRAYAAGKATPEGLKKNWNSDKIFRKLVTLVRLSLSDKIFVSAEDETVAAFLKEQAREVAASAADPAHSGDKVTDQYLTAVKVIRDRRSGEETETGNADIPAAAVAAWPEQPDLYARTELGLADDGFPEAGSEPVLLQDPANGLWVWITPDLRIEIRRYEQEKPALVWYEADIRIRPGSGEYLRTFAFENGKANKPEKLCEETGLVFGINTDLYQYRKSYKLEIGLIVRDGKVIYELENASNRLTQLPPLDTLLLNAAGDFRIDGAGALSADEALAEGATDVLSFGPILVRDSMLRVHSPKVGSAKEPRTAIGKLGDHHYLAVAVEGRLNRSQGITLSMLGQLMLARGCDQAINMDGGHTSVMMFMGERLNTIGSFTGSNAASSSRTLYELLGVGVRK